MIKSKCILQLNSFECIMSGAALAPFVDAQETIAFDAFHWKHYYNILLICILKHGLLQSSLANAQNRSPSVCLSVCLAVCWPVVSIYLSLYLPVCVSCLLSSRSTCLQSLQPCSVLSENRWKTIFAIISCWSSCPRDPTLDKRIEDEDEWRWTISANTYIMSTTVDTKSFSQMWYKIMRRYSTQLTLFFLRCLTI